MKTQEDPLVSLSGVSKWFGDEHVLKGVDFELQRGTVTALLGRNGSGKSTLIRILLGVLARDGGNAQVLGSDPEDLTVSTRERIAWVTDATNGTGYQRVIEEVEFQARLRGKRWSEERATSLLERFEVPLHKRVATLSKGQQTRLRLVIALAADPELLLLDEPALGLDLFARHDFLEAIIETVEKEGRAVLIASHLIDDVERVADRVVFIKKGVVRAQGTLEELREQFRRVRVTIPDAGPEPLERTCEELIGIERCSSEPNGPSCERVVIFNDFTAGLLDELCERSGATQVEARRMSLREIYFEVLAEREGVKA